MSELGVGVEVTSGSTRSSRYINSSIRTLRLKQRSTVAHIFELITKKRNENGLGAAHE